MAVNTFVPAGLTNKRAYNWSRNAYNDSDAPVVGKGSDPTAQKQLLASYEWLGYGSTVPDQATRWYTNPPFIGWEAGRLPDWLVAYDSSGNQIPARILRGYIRRAEYNVGDQTSMSRLYFMYNPETITRSYLSYLDSGSLDPFNTVFQSGNLVAPPSLLDFEFELFFDRQDEAQDADHPGVLVDLEYFDLVVRNVVPGAEYSTNATLPDNGVMMVNPRDITVVFSPPISIQGRPTNATVVFEKFTHRMVPTRMRIKVQMRALYFGPVRDVTQFKESTVEIERRVPFTYTSSVIDKFNLTYKPLEWLSNGEDITAPPGEGNEDGDTDTFDDWGDVDVNNLGQVAMTNAYGASRRNGEFFTQYSKGSRAQLWDYADCSSYVWAGFAYDNPGESSVSNISGRAALLSLFGWPSFEDGRRTGNIPSTAGMLTKWLALSSSQVRVLKLGDPTNTDYTEEWENMRKMSPGDILVRYNHPDRAENHIAFLWKKTENGVEVLHASDSDNDITISTYSKNSKIQYTHAVRILARVTTVDELLAPSTDNSLGGPDPWND